MLQPDENTNRQREMFTLEAQLRSSVRLQLENTRDSIRALAGAQEKLKESGDALSKVTTLCGESETLIENYPFIRQVSRTHQNFNLTKRVYDEFCALDAKVERCAQLLEADQESGEPNNLLLVYHYLSRLENFRKQTLELMSDAPSTAVYTIKRYFKKLDDLMGAFEDFFWKLPRQLFQMLANNQSTFIVSMVKVLWSMAAEQRPRFNAILDDVISHKFSDAITEGGAMPADDPATCLETLQFWQSDLVLIRNGLVPKFPPESNILDFFVLIYHRNIHGVLSMCLTGKLGPADILYIIGWTRTYHDEMAAELGISADDLEPRLLDDREPELIATYVSLSRGKINEWIGNLFTAFSQGFIKRTAPPDADAENHYMTPAGIDLFQIVKQHIGTAAQASKGRLLLEIIGECAKAVIGFVNNTAKMLEAERQKQATFIDKSETAAAASDYLEDHVIMLGNTCLKWVSYVDDLVVEVEGSIAAEFNASAAKTLKNVADAFVGLAKSCTQVLVDIIFKIVKPAVAQLFTPIWYGEDLNVMDTICATLDDFFQDYQQHADIFLLNKLVADVLERLVLSYLGQARSKGSRLQMPMAAKLLEADHGKMEQFFSTYRDGERVKRALDPLAKFVALIGSSQRMLFLEFVAFWKVYPDMSLSFFEEILMKRDDLDKSAVREIIESCKKKTLEDKIVDTAPSIFSKLPIK